MDHVEFTDRRSLPMMALRGLTVFPGMMLTFEVERSMSIAALNMAMSDDQIIYLVPQIDIATDIPTPEDVYGVGTVCRIKQMMKQPGSKTVRVMAEGIERGRTLAVRTDMPCFVAEVEPMPDVAERKTARIEALIRHCCNLFDAYVTVSGNMAPESVITVLGSTNAGFVSNFIAQHVFLRPEQPFTWASGIRSCLSRRGRAAGLRCCRKCCCMRRVCSACSISLRRRRRIVSTRRSRSICCANR